MDDDRDRIELRGLRLMGICGVLPHERELAQPLELDIDVMVDMSRASVSDMLPDTVDYAALLGSVEHVVTVERFALLERLAGRVADVLLGHGQVDAVSVAVRKLRPPVAHDLDTCGVRITRSA